ncbi:hypothetical protein PR002_g6776 [Phytophthora rubi]|uniref:Uncharacterized protein n=1 Tax=Phytophthora rubi TaxID=129364 RepID=A0A6A3MZ29_9STRA|nr:hypothetical protein PR002_g6776 [Phytophthora rubi]
MTNFRLRLSDSFQNKEDDCDYAYALLKPDDLETTGYTYDKVSDEASQGTFDVEELGDCTVPKASPEVEKRVVTQEVALSGIGTYVGSALCIARVLPGKPKVCDYGVAVGYSWSSQSNSGALQVTFADGTVEFAFKDDGLKDLAVETYALQSCYLRGVTDIMLAEMRSLHAAVYDHFHGIGQAAP